jgi:YebC/PmpR family DNA-binding regulatory protein
MPKDNIARAIDRGMGKGGAAALETVTYEGYAPGKVAIIIAAATDNKNRTTPEVKSLLEKSGGTFATPGAVSWMFMDCGMIIVPANGKTFEELFDIAVEAGADDVEDAGDAVIVYTKSNQLEVVKRELEGKGLTIESAELAKKPTTLTEVSEETAHRVMGMIEKLEDMDDVQKVWSNIEILEEANP